MIHAAHLGAHILVFILHMWMTVNTATTYVKALYAPLLRMSLRLLHDSYL